MSEPAGPAMNSPVDPAGNGNGRRLAPSAPGGLAAESNPLAVLDKIRRPRAVPPPGERCDFCGAEVVADHHGHVVDLVDRGLRCACRPCYLTFEPEGAGGKRFRAVPPDYAAVEDFRLTPAEWDGLQIPVGVAFFFRNSEVGRVVAFYPSPAGATESQLPMDRWGTIAEGNPTVAAMAPDVQALLVRTHKDADAEGYIVPIDACYELVGLLRKTWKGFDGGQEAKASMAQFFDTVRSNAGIKS